MYCDGCNRPTKVGYPQNLEQTILFCFSCHERASAIRLQAMNHSVGMMNQLRNQIEDMFGAPRTQGIQIPQPTYNIGDTTNHINVENSIVGAINTGITNSLNASLNNAALSDEQAAEHLKALAEGIGSAKSLVDDDKEQLLEMVSFLAQQVANSKESRNNTMIKSALDRIKTSLSTSSDLITLAPVLIELTRRLF